MEGERREGDGEMGEERGKEKGKEREKEKGRRQTMFR